MTCAGGREDTAWGAWGATPLSGRDRVQTTEALNQEPLNQEPNVRVRISSLKPSVRKTLCF